MSRVLVLGGGFGGLAAAHALRTSLGAEHRVLLVERRSTFVMGLRKSWALVGESDLATGERRLDRLAAQGIELIAGEITGLDPAARAVEVGGRRLEAEAMVVALGAQRVPEAVPGFVDRAHNVYDVGGIDRAAAALRAFDGGVIAVVIFGAPYTCPPAPYEVAFLVNDRMRRAGIQAQIDVFSPQPVSLPVVGAVGCQTLETRLADEGIAFHPNHHAVSVEPGEVVFQEGRYPFDLLLGVPPHRCPPIVVSAGLTDGRAWVPVDPATMATRVPGVYAVGDIVEIPTANGLTLPKAGVFAEAQARVAAEHIAALLRGATSPATFHGDGFCYLEVGQGMALEVRGDFLAAPAPAVVVGEPRADLLEEKHRFEAERLARWFGE